LLKNFFFSNKQKFIDRPNGKSFEFLNLLLMGNVFISCSTPLNNYTWSYSL